MYTRYMRLEEAAVQAGVSIATLRRWVADGRLGSVRIGRTIRIAQTSVDEILTPKPTEDLTCRPERCRRG